MNVFLFSISLGLTSDLTNVMLYWCELNNLQILLNRLYTFSIKGIMRIDFRSGPC